MTQIAPTSLTLRRPDDWHVHLRDGPMLAAVVPYTARQFARAIVMPNLAAPVVTAADAAGYRARIEAALPAGSNFTPLMTAYLTDGTNINPTTSGPYPTLQPGENTVSWSGGITGVIVTPRWWTL